MIDYDELVCAWRAKRISTAAGLAAEINGNGAKFIYHNGKIENDKITYHDTREIFDRGGVTSYTGDVRTLFEIQNLCAGYQRFLTAFGRQEPLTAAFVREIHGILTQGTYDAHGYEIGERPGTYKLHDFVTGVDGVGALPEDVAQEMAELLDELRDVANENALTAAAYFRAKLENIHPFADGNGRVGRLLVNFLKDQCRKTWDRNMERQAQREQKRAAVQKMDMAEQLASAIQEVRRRSQERQVAIFPPPCYNIGGMSAKQFP